MTIHKLKNFTFLILILLLGIGFILSIYYTSNAFTAINEMVYEWVKSLVYEQEKGPSGLFMQMGTIIILCTSTFIFYLLFSSGLSILFLRKTEGFKRVLKWKLHKYKKAFIPLWAMKTIAIAFVAACVFFFNTIVTFSGISIILISFLASFALLNIITLLFISLVFSLSQIVKLNYGTEIALISPEIDNKSVETLAKSEKINIPLVSIYLFFALFLILQLLKTNEAVLLPLLLMNVISYAGIKYLKTTSYLRPQT